jgi:hypothetical protein
MLAFCGITPWVPAGAKKIIPGLSETWSRASRQRLAGQGAGKFFLSVSKLTFCSGGYA